MQPFFESPTQYDERYLGIDNNRSTCSFFSLFTLEQFLLNGDLTPEQHQKNLDASVGNYLMEGIQGHLSFFELLGFAYDCPETKVEATSVSMIREKILGYDHIFKKETDDLKRYGIIFLKNSKFFVVLVNPDNESAGCSYHVRDCHDPVQYNFTERTQLTEFLDERHEFNRDLIIDGFVVGEFSNIEFLSLETLKTRLNPALVPPTKDEKDTSSNESALEKALRLSREEHKLTSIDPELKEAIKVSEMDEIDMAMKAAIKDSFHEPTDSELEDSELQKALQLSLGSKS